MASATAVEFLTVPGALVGLAVAAAGSTAVAAGRTARNNRRATGSIRGGPAIRAGMPGTSGSRARRAAGTTGGTTRTGGGGRGSALGRLGALGRGGGSAAGSRARRSTNPSGATASRTPGRKTPGTGTGTGEPRSLLSWLRRRTQKNRKPDDTGHGPDTKRRDRRHGPETDRPGQATPDSREEPTKAKKRKRKKKRKDGQPKTGRLRALWQHARRQFRIGFYEGLDAIEHQRAANPPKQREPRVASTIRRPAGETPQQEPTRKPAPAPVALPVPATVQPAAPTPRTYTAPSGGSPVTQPADDQVFLMAAFLHHAEQMLEIASTWERPKAMLTIVDHEYPMSAVVVKKIAEAFQAFHKRVSDHQDGDAVPQAVVDTFEQLFATILAGAQVAEKAAELGQGLVEEERQRLADPRYRKWDHARHYGYQA